MNRSALQHLNLRPDEISWSFGEHDPQDVVSLSLCRWDDAQVLKTALNRRILWVRGDHGALLVKHFFYRGRWEALGAKLLGGGAGQEWKALQEARRRGLPAPKAVALGRSGRYLPKESLLVMEGLEGVLSAEEHLFGPGAPVGAVRRKTVAELGQLIRTAHDRGLVHHDLHFGNILIRSRGRQRELFLVDFHRCVFLTRLSPRGRWRNLAILHGGSVHASNLQRMRFLRAYLAVDPKIDVNLRWLVARLEKLGMRHRLRIWRSRGKRCLKVNRDFNQIPSKEYTIFVHRRLCDAMFQERLQAPAALLAGAQIKKSSRTTRVGVLNLPHRTLYMKRYNLQGLGYALKDLCRSSRARRVWTMANSCVMRKIDVAPPVAYVERRRFGFLLESYIVTEAVAGQDLAGLLVSAAADFQEKRRLIRVLARLLTRMHDNEVAHRDLKAENIIGQRDHSGGYKLAIVDFDGFRVGRVSRRSQVRNLVRLHRDFLGTGTLTRTDRLRFLRVYLGPRFDKDWRKYWRAVSGQSFGWRAPFIY